MSARCRYLAHGVNTVIHNALWASREEGVKRKKMKQHYSLRRGRTSKEEVFNHRGRLGVLWECTTV